MNRPNSPANGILLALRRLIHDATGNVLPMAAAGILVMVGLIGGGVDMSRSYRVQSRLQSACDAAVLAGRKAVSTNGYGTTEQAQATQYFQVNFDQSRQEVKSNPAPTFVTSSPDNGVTVVASASAVVPMKMMAVFGKQTMTMEAQCQAT
jgi:Flp pilus assembly protein TadG